MSQVPHREAGEAALDIRGEQERRCRVTCCWLRAIQLPHDERRLLGKLGSPECRLAARFCLRGAVMAQIAAGLNVILIVCAVGVVQW
jgi:hypothetical protein